MIINRTPNILLLSQQIPEYKLVEDRYLFKIVTLVIIIVAPKG